MNQAASTIWKSLFHTLSLFVICAMLTVQFGSAAQARYISPDDYDPTMPGVGTNRYSYAGNDPVNKNDPNGHLFDPASIGIAIGVALGALGALLGGTTEANTPGAGETPQSKSDGQQIAGMIAGAAGGTIFGKIGGAALDRYGKKKDKDKDAKAGDVEGQAVNTQDQAATESTADIKSDAGVRTGYNDINETIQTSAGPAKIEARVTISGNNATVDVQSITGPGAGKVGLTETRSLGKALADQVRSDYGISGNVTFSGARVTGARTGINTIGSVTFPGQ